MLILENYAFLDVEASSLDLQESYPIQIGWARPTLPLEKHSLMVRPEPDWTDWNPRSQQIHGFSREQVMVEGLPADEVALRLNSALEGRRVFVDAQEHDGFWLRRLYRAAGFPPTFRIEEENLAFKDAILSAFEDLNAGIRMFAQVEEWAERSHPHTHKADEDALQRAAVMRALVDPVLRLQMQEAHDAAIARRFPALRG